MKLLSLPGGETGDGSGRDRRRSRQEIGEQRIRQGLRRSGAVSAAEEKQRLVCGVDQGPGWSQH